MTAGMFSVRSIWLVICALTANLCSIGLADAPRVLAPGQLPKDIRLEPLKDLDGYFPFTPPGSLQEWTNRAERVRRQLLVTLGLWPMPTRTPLNAVVHGKVERDDYTVEKVYFESAPGFFVTGNLYRPKNRTGKMPGVLCPHGHWSDGRFHDNAGGIRNEIAQGAERFEEGGRSPLQARCVQLARMGCVVFHYDMLGYADSVQIPFEIAHRFAIQRPEMNVVEDWGLFSAPAEARLQNVMGLQTLNSIRSLDFLLSLPEVDPDRIAVTGASGGGTQSFILAAIDPRVALSFPAVMVSTAMQGGCTCENAAGLRIGTGNIEFAALFAPKPLGLTAADDWTREIATKGFPELKHLYSMMGARENVMLKAATHFGHNYNHVSRVAMYNWINKHFKLGFQEPVLERDYQRLTREEMSVWNQQHPKPESSPEFERRLLSWLTEDNDQQLARSRGNPARYRELVGPAVDILIGRNLSQTGEVEFELKQKTDRGRYLQMSGLLRNRTHGEELPALFLYPKEWNGRTVLWLDDSGKAALIARNGDPIPEAQALLDSGATIAGVDLLFQGEFLPDGQPITQTRRVKNPRQFAGYTLGYNHSLFAQRVHDVLTLIRFVQTHERQTKQLDLVAWNTTGPIAAAARAQARGAIRRALIDTDGFRFGRLLDFHDPTFLPGGAKYDDLPGLLALAAPEELALVNETPAGIDFVRSFYRSAHAESKLVVLNDAAGDLLRRGIDWLLQ